MNLQVVDINGSAVSKMRVDASVFGIEPNDSVVHQTVLSELANMRQGTHAAKNRSKVRGGGKKPWRQKGRGVARAGSIRSPLWKGGGTIFGPEPHSYTQKINKKMKHLARRSVLSAKVAKGEVIILDNFKLEQPKTKEFVELLSRLDLQDKKVTVLLSKITEKDHLASRNLPNVFLIQASSVSTYDLIDCDVLLFDKAGLADLNKLLGES